MAVDNVPELLYHTVLTVIDYQKEPSEATRSVYVLGTHSALEAAKAFAISALQGLNYQPEDFIEFAVRSSEPWEHDDGRLVFARTPAGQVLLIGIDTTLNIESLLASPDGAVVLPNGCNRLHYVLQTIDNSLDRMGYGQPTKIQGIYVHRADAWAARSSSLSATCVEVRRSPTSGRLRRTWWYTPLWRRDRIALRQ
ncbi:uncharacterized protein BKA55DRAFT_530523 [Fusarium redolens]|uniref:Uncharacterized protein n=1 Tax=Fusarium redolens TaxID=48865 RepID=A0A9P9FX23_FUSRE|nr:uncharacterized protein BKA55DRAFT_530523 [Fusarium redolens]KAH7205478.1 hypothetical protein BKA55DRAFT_530523 [Fusarium redolens]